MQSFVAGREFTVSSVSFGVFQGSTTVIARLYANNGAPFPAEIGTLIGTSTVNVTPGQVVTIAHAAAVDTNFGTIAVASGSLQVNQSGTSSFIHTGTLTLSGGGLTFTQAANRCRAAGSHLCKSSEFRGFMTVGTVLGETVVDDWIDDQDADSSALFINNAGSAADPDGAQATTTSLWGRCCLSVE